MRMCGVLVLTCTFVGVHAVAGDGDGVLGVWLTDKAEAHVEIFKQKDKYCGKIAWLKEPLIPEGDENAGKPKTDHLNPDPKKRNGPILGMQFLNGFVYKGENVWTGGTVYDAESGKTYKAKMTLKDKNTLHLRGYVGFSLLGRTTVWTRVKADKAAPKDEDRKEPSD